MMKLVVLFVLVAISAADIVSRQRAVIPHHSKFGYGDGISSRYFDKVEATGHYGLKYDDGLKYGYGPAYDLRYDGYGAGLGYGYGPAYGLNNGGLKYGYGPARGLNYGAGLKYGYGPAYGLKYGGYGAGLGLGYNLGYGGYGWAYPGVYTAVTV